MLSLKKTNKSFDKSETCAFISKLFQPIRLFFLKKLSAYTVIQAYTVIRDNRVNRKSQKKESSLLYTYVCTEGIFDLLPLI